MSSRNLIINGSSSTNGGDFEKVSIRGEGTVFGDVQSNTVHIYGQGMFHDQVNAKSLKVVGQADIDGALKADSAKVYGQLDLKKSSEIQHLIIRGEVKCHHHLKGEKVDNKGSLKVNGDIHCDSFHSKGECKIDGLLSAEEINLNLLYSTSRITEIGGSKVSVNKQSLPSVFQFGTKKAHLVATEIEADDVYLEYTTAKIVRGNHVKIGPSCDIDVVEYSGSIKVSPSSTVRKEINTSIKSIDEPKEIE